MSIKLPKQWLHWVQKAQLKPDTKHCGLYLSGRNRHWRVDCYGIFECSCPLEYFDRWANSSGAEHPKIPQTEKEFLSAVKELHYLSKDTK